MRADEVSILILIMLLAHGLGIIGALGVLSYQIYINLDTGYWYSLSVITVLRWMGVEWAFTPQAWFGAYKILDDVPLSLAILFCGFGIVFLANSLLETK